LIVIGLTSNIGRLTINFAAYSVRLCKLAQQQLVVQVDASWSCVMPTRHGQSNTPEDQMTSDTGIIRFVSLAMLITVTGLFFLNYLST
jgi:hypothetical protein